jgi:hypothetical protein
MQLDLKGEEIQEWNEEMYERNNRSEANRQIESDIKRVTRK